MRNPDAQLNEVLDGEEGTNTADKATAETSHEAWAICKADSQTQDRPHWQRSL